MGIERDLTTPLAEAVRQAKSQSAFARLVGRSQSTVYGWLKDDVPLPAELVLTVEEATGVSRFRLRPDVYRPSHAIGLSIDDGAVPFDPTANPNGDDA